MMRFSSNFFQSVAQIVGLAGIVGLATAVPANANVGEETRYQVYSLQQSLRATNARVDQLEKEIARLRSEISDWRSGGQHQVSHPSPSSQQQRTQPPAPPRGTSTVHHVASGDTLSSISRRYGIGLDRIIAANPGLDPHRLRIGQPVTVPGGGGSPARAPRETPPAPAATTGVYTVRSGDTLSSIARRHNTSPTQLVALNGLSNPNALSIGQQLNVPGAPASSGNRYGGGASSPPAPQPSSAPPEPQPEEPADPSSELVTAPDGYGYYQVVRNDTLYSIALSFGTTSRELRKLNDLNGDDQLEIGQYLLVPVADDSLYEG